MNIHSERKNMNITCFAAYSVTVALLTLPSHDKVPDVLHHITYSHNAHSTP